MKLLSRCILAVAIFSFGITQLKAQCTSASLNWDALDFLQEGTNVSNAIATNQKFAFGKNKFTLTHNYALANAVGDNTTNTGETGSYGAGADVQFKGDGTITLTFASPVENVKFSLYDIDFGQKVLITALNGATAQNVVINTIGTSNLLKQGSGTTNALVISDSTITVKVQGNKTTTTINYTNVANTSTAGTINVDIAGPATSVTLAFSNTHTDNSEDGSFWLSDIAGCITNTSFPLAYGAVSKPYTGQPGYILTARDHEVYMVDPASGTAKFLFADPSLKNINSMGYDPYNKILYYTYSLTAVDGQGKAAVNPNDKTINKYDFKTETYSTFVADVTTLGIPVFGSGVESGGASYYDGALYLGIEGSSASGSTDESIVWRIDMDAFGNATSATQVFGFLTTSHDWGDYVITDGILYDFDGKATLQNIYHFNLQSGALTDYSVSPDTVHQVAADWSGQVFNIGAISTSNTKGEVMPYQYNGKFKSSAIKPILANGVAIAGSWGDAASAFKPKSDFGDAPSSYDPDPLAPAVHDTSTNLRLGSNESIQWDKPAAASLGTLANTDTYDDGLPYVRIMVTTGNNYQTDVNVFNNTGANATLAAWIDFNNNGLFESSECSVLQTVSSSNTMQIKSLFWPSITSTLAPNSYTYLRIRITSAANSLTTAKATGWFSDGEVEDYYLPVNNSVLAVSVLNFSAKKISDEKSIITWDATTDEANTSYEVERSADGQIWTTIHKQTATLRNLTYNVIDVQPFHPVSHYRLKYHLSDGTIQYSKAVRLTFSDPHALQVYPNPAIDKLVVTIIATRPGNAAVTLRDISGKTVWTINKAAVTGSNTWTLPFPKAAIPGLYTLVITTTDKTYTEKLVIKNR